MRVTLLSREIAARVITSAVSTLAWAAGAAVILLVIPVLIESLARIGRLDALLAPLGFLLVILAGIAIALWRMRPAVVIGFLVVATAAAIGYQLTLLEMHPQFLDDELYLVNRPMLALVTIGAAARTALGGILWCASGYVAGWGATVTVAAIADVPVRAGWGSTITLGLAVVLYLTLFAIQERQRRKLPRFDELEEATRRRAASADLARRTTAIVHDTVLNDLTVVMNAPEVLDERARARLLADLDTLEGGTWRGATKSLPVQGEEQTRIRNEFTRMASDFRWRGLTVNSTGAGGHVFEYEPGAGDALVAAVRAALENALQHSGTDSADVEIMYSDGEVIFMVSDQGRGFDTSAIAPDRLGIRDSIIGRIEDVGGRARIWSSPGAGTSVLVAVPVRAVAEGGSAEAGSATGQEPEDD